MSANIRPEPANVNYGNAADAVVEALVDEGVRFVFGMTGDTILPIIDVRIDPWQLAHRAPEFKEFHKF